MNPQNSIRNLQMITALDSWSYGLLYQYFPGAEIINLGGTNTTVALYLTGTFLAKFFAPEILAMITEPRNGKKQKLFFSLTISMFTQIMMAVTKNYWVLIFMRVIFSAVDRTQDFCLELLLEKEQNRHLEGRLKTNFNILRGSGFILGPIVSGFIFDMKNGFRFIAMLDALLTLINIIILAEVDEDSDYNNNNNFEPPNTITLRENYNITCETLKNAELNKNWDIILIQSLFVSSYIIFSTEFPKIMSYSYRVTSSSTIGLTIAYINALGIAFNNCAVNFMSNIESYPTIFASELLFFIITIFMFLIWYAPTYDIFLILIVPITFVHSLINKTMWERLFAERNNDHLSDINKNLSLFVAGFTIPILFAIVYNKLNHHAVIIFTFMPLLICWCITRFYSRFLEIEEPCNPLGQDNDNYPDCDF